MPVTDFHRVADNLCESFRVLADGRPRASITALRGLNIASLGVTFQMFNAAFLAEPVETVAALEEILANARRHFEARSLRWAIWICEDWLASNVRRKLSRICENFGLRLSADMPGLVADYLNYPSRPLPDLEVRRVEAPGISSRTVEDFRALGSTCFHVPISWFSEVFDDEVATRGAFVCWVGYREGQPIATAATVSSPDVIGLYNVATAPAYRHYGYGEAITRHAIEAANRETGATTVVLQSTSQGLRLYERIGFQPITRVLVYNSTP